MKGRTRKSDRRAGGENPVGGAAVEPETGATLARRHVRFGWWSLLGFLALGIVLEALHGFKVGWYMNVSTEIRRLMFTLAHAHGTLFSLVNIVFGVCAGTGLLRATALGTASRLLLSGGLLLPLGFLAGGFFIQDGDPGLGILLVPLGAFLLLGSVLLTARAS